MAREKIANLLSCDGFEIELTTSLSKVKQTTLRGYNHSSTDNKNSFYSSEKKIKSLNRNISILHCTLTDKTIITYLTRRS